MNFNRLSKDRYKTILTIVVGFLVVYIFTKWHWTLYVSLIVGVSSLFSGYLAQKIEFIWFKIAWLLSLLIPNILMTLIFYFFLTPIALLSKFFGDKNPLNLKNSENSLFKETNKSFSKDSFEKIW